MMMPSAIFLALLGLGLIFLGMLILSSPAKESRCAKEAYRGSPDLEGEKAVVKGGAVVMIGPIPIVVGSDWRISLLLMLTAIGLMLLWFIMMRSA
jgi:uncharacterized protein (TIGR00304 family)